MLITSLVFWHVLHIFFFQVSQDPCFFSTKSAQVEVEETVNFEVAKANIFFAKLDQVGKF